MSRNASVLNIKPKNSLVLDTKAKNKLVLDIKPHDRAVNEISWTQVEFSQGQSLGPGWYMYVTYPVYTTMRIN